MLVRPMSLPIGPRRYCGVEFCELLSALFTELILMALLREFFFLIELSSWLDL